MNEALNRVLSRLKGVKQSGSGWQALCPAHDDKRQSLKIDGAKDGRVLLKCFAGCSTEDICAAIGLTIKDLFPEPERKQAGRGEIIARYDYIDEAGQLLFQVVRTSPKGFFQRRPDGKGGWTNGLGGTKPVPYRLPELLKAVQRGETIFIPEGEKDADNLTRLGLAATTSPMGAEKWREHYSDYLMGANVVVLPDNDEPGRKHAQQVAQSLGSKAASVKVLELPGLPAKGDISDWLAAGHGKDELLRLVSECPEWEPIPGAEDPGPADEGAIIVQLADVEPEEVSWLWEPYIPCGKLTILEGDPGVGKTWLALQLAAIVSQGDPFPGPDGVPGGHREPAAVVYMTAEDGLGDTLRPRLDKASADITRVFAITGKTSGDGKDSSVSLSDIDVLDAALEQLKPALLVVDPLQAYLGAGVDMHRANEVRPVLAGLAGLAEKHRCAVLCIRHLGKSQQDRSIYRGLGSIDFSAAARSVLLVGRDPNNPKKRVLAQHKCSLATEGTSLVFELREDGFFWSGVSDMTAEQILAPPRSEEEKTAMEEAGDWLHDVLANGPVDSKQILKDARQAGIAERTLHRAKAALGVTSQKIGKGWVWKIVMDSENDESYKDTSGGNLGNVDLNPTATRDTGYEPTWPCGNLNLDPFSPTATRDTEKFANIAKQEPLGGESQGEQPGNLKREVLEI